MKSLSALKWLSGLAAGVSPLVPGLSYVLQTSPPLFPGISSITTALAAVAIIGVFTYRFRRGRRKYGSPITLRYGLVCLATAIPFLVIYLVLLDLCSVIPPKPRDQEGRVQIGFGMARWGLTSETEAWMATRGEPPTAQELLLQRGGYAEGGVYRIWNREAVYLAATLLLGLFFLASVSWTLGWAFLAKAVQESEESDSN